MMLNENTTSGSSSLQTDTVRLRQCKFSFFYTDEFYYFIVTTDVLVG